MRVSFSNWSTPEVPDTCIEFRMEKNNPLLPFAFSTSYADEKIPLNTTPRERHVIDENASSMYHTRTSAKTMSVNRPALHFAPALKRKQGESFNEKDDIKRIEFDNDFFHHPGPSTLQDSDPETGNENQDFAAETLPSSPPVLPQMSEYDQTVSTYTIPDSPIDPDCTFRDLNTSPVKHERPRLQTSNQSSEADFGIDQFNRFKTLSYIQCPSTDMDPEDYQSNYEKKQNATAREIILQAFDDVSLSVSLVGMDLTEIPDEVKDLNSLVKFDEHSMPSLYQLYLTNNRLRSLNPALFKFEKLNVLSLRLNKLRNIPSAIGQLVNLVDFNISINQLKWLPAQILELPNLITFSAGPNPFISVDEDTIEVRGDAAEVYPRIYTLGHKLNHVSRIKYFQPAKYVPSLKTLCLNTIARYDVTYRETRTWKKSTPRILHTAIAAAVHKGKYEEKCNECDTIVVEPYAHVFEWWDVLGNKNIPFKREFCSGQCVTKYKSRTKALSLS